MKVLCAISRGMHIDGDKSNLGHEFGEILQVFIKDHQFTEFEKKAFLIAQVELSDKELSDMRGDIIAKIEPKKIILDLKNIKAKAFSDIQEYKAVSLDATAKSEIEVAPRTEKAVAVELVGE